jgi:hypothetical protein
MDVIQRVQHNNSIMNGRTSRTTEGDDGMSKSRRKSSLSSNQEPPAANVYILRFFQGTLKSTDQSNPVYRLADVSLEIQLGKIIYSNRGIAKI